MSESVLLYNDKGTAYRSIFPPNDSRAAPDDKHLGSRTTFNGTVDSLSNGKDDAGRSSSAIKPSPPCALATSKEVQRLARTSRASSLYSVDPLGPLQSSSHLSKGAKHLIRFTGGGIDSVGSGSEGDYRSLPSPLPLHFVTEDRSALLRYPIERFHHHQHHHQSHLRYPSFYFRKLPKAYRSPTQRSRPHLGSPLCCEKGLLLTPSSTGSSSGALLSTTSPSSFSFKAHFASSPISARPAGAEMSSDKNGIAPSLLMESMIKSPLDRQFAGPVTHILPSDNTSANTPMFATISLENYRRQLASERLNAKQGGQKYPPSSKGHQRNRANSESTYAKYHPGSFAWYEPPTTRDKPLPRPSEHYSRPSTSGSSGGVGRSGGFISPEKKRVAYADQTEMDCVDTPRSGWDDDDEEEQKKSNGLGRWNSLKFKSSKRKDASKYPHSTANTLGSYSDPLHTTLSSRNVTRFKTHKGKIIYLPEEDDALSSSFHFVTAHTGQGSLQTPSAQSSLGVSHAPPIQSTSTQQTLSPRPNNARPVLVRNEAINNHLETGSNHSHTATQQESDKMKKSNAFTSSNRLSVDAPRATRKMPLSEEYFRTMGWTRSARNTSRSKDQYTSETRDEGTQGMPHRITLDAVKKAPADCPLLDILKKPDDCPSAARESAVEGLASPIQLIEKGLPRVPSMLTNKIDSLIDQVKDGSQVAFNRSEEEHIQQQHDRPSGSTATTPKTTMTYTDSSHEAPSPPDPPTPSPTRCSPLSSFFEGYGDQSMPTADREQWYQDARLGKSTFGGEEMHDDMTEFPLWQEDEKEPEDSENIVEATNLFPSAQRVRSPYEGLFDAYVNSNVSLAASRQSIRPEVGNSDALSIPARSTDEQTKSRKMSSAELTRGREGSKEQSLETMAPSLHIASQGLNISFEDQTSAMKVSVMYRAALTHPGGKNDMNFCGAIALSEDDMKRICESWLSLRHRTRSVMSTPSEEEEDVIEEAQEVVSFPADDYQEERMVMEKRQEDLKREVSTKMKLLRNRSINRSNTNATASSVFTHAAAAGPPSSSSSSTGTPHIKPLLLGSNLLVKATRSAEDLIRKTSTRDAQALQRLQRRPYSSSTESVMSLGGVSIAYRSANHSIGGHKSPISM